jgi:hypothetical protein
VLPNKRRQAKRDFHAKAEELEQHLIEVMGEQFEHELARSMDRVREAISPYTRFVRSQHEHLGEMRTQLTAVDNDMLALRHRVGGEPRLPPGERVQPLPGQSRAFLPQWSNIPSVGETVGADPAEHPDRSNARDAQPDSAGSVSPTEES